MSCTKHPGTSHVVMQTEWWYLWDFLNDLVSVDSKLSLPQKELGRNHGSWSSHMPGKMCTSVVALFISSLSYLLYLFIFIFYLPPLSRLIENVSWASLFFMRAADWVYLCATQHFFFLFNTLWYFSCESLPDMDFSHKWFAWTRYVELRKAQAVQVACWVYIPPSPSANYVIIL